MKEISRLNYWIQRAIPFVYDDTLSLYELVAKTVAYLNNVIESQNDLSKEMAEFIDKFEGDLTNTITEILNVWLEDGTLANIINNDVFNMKLDKTTFDSFIVENNDYKESVNKKFQTVDGKILDLENTVNGKLVNYIYPTNLGDDTDHVNNSLLDLRVNMLMGEFKINKYGIRPKSSTIIDLQYATLKQITNTEKLYYLINIKDVDNVYITGGVLIGDMVSKPNTVVGEEGHGLQIVNSTNIFVKDMIIKECWGDGIYLGHEYQGSSTKVTDNVVLEDIVIDYAGRNGISVCGGKNLKIIRPIINNVNRTDPKAGIDIEPEGVGGVKPLLENLLIDNPTITNCGLGLMYNLNFQDRPTLIVNHVLRDFNIKNCGIGVHVVSGGKARGNATLENFNIVDSQNNGLFIGNYYTLGTPKLTLKNFNIDNFNVVKSSSEIWSSAVVLYSANALANLGNFIIDTISIDRDSTLTGNKVSFYIFNESGVGFKDIIVENITKVVKLENAFVLRITNNAETDIIVNDFNRVLSHKSTWGVMELGRNLITHFDNNGSTADNFYDLKNIMIQDVPITIVNTGTANIVLRSDGTIYPFNFKNIKLFGRGATVTIMRKGNNYYVTNHVGTVNEY